MTLPRHGGEHPLNLPMKISDLAEQVGHSERTVRRWIAERDIQPAGKVSRANYYWLSDILVAERDTRVNQLSGLRNSLAHRVA